MIESTKAILDKPFELHNEIIKLRERIAILYSTIDVKSPKLSKDPKPSNKPYLVDEIGETMPEIMELKEKLEVKEKECETAKKKALDLLVFNNCLDNNIFSIMIDRYTKFMKWEDIAKKINYSLSYVYSLHSLGLRQLEKIVVK